MSTLLAGGLLVLAACGSTASESPDAAPAGSTAPAPGSAATEQAPEVVPPESTAEVADVTPSTPSTPADSSSADSSQDSGDAESDAGSTSTSAPAAPAATGAPAPAPTTQPAVEALPDDGCSADNSPTDTDVADGPLPAIEVRAASADNPLPDLAVRRVNCAGGWVNLKNEIPAELPVLVWFWAPH